MVNTEKLIQKTFLKLLEKKNIDEIDVNSLCEKLQIKRQTFYYHYKNIYDLIFSIYINENIKPYESGDLSIIVENVYRFLYSNHEFNVMVSKSNAADALKDFLYSYVHKSISKYLGKYNLRVDDIREIARFYSRAVVEKCVYDFSELEYSIEEGCLKVSLLFNNDILMTTIRKYQNNVR